MSLGTEKYSGCSGSLFLGVSRPAFPTWILMDPTSGLEFCLRLKLMINNFGPGEDVSNKKDIKKSENLNSTHRIFAMDQ